MLASAALALQILESLRSLGLTEALWFGVDQPVEPLELVGQFSKAGPLVGRKPPVLAGGQVIEQAPAEVFLKSLPGLGRLTEPGQHRSQGRAHWLLVGGRTFQAGEGGLEPGRIQALHRKTQPVA